MSLEHNKSIVRRYLDEVINSGNIDVANEIFSHDYVNHSAGPGFGLELPQFLRGIIDMKAAFPDWRVTIRQIVAEGDVVVDCVSISATHSGSVNGIPASGLRIETLAMHMWRVVDGKLVEGWYATDALPRVIAATVPTLAPVR